MELSDARIILFIVILFAAWRGGRYFQRMIDSVRSWRGTVASVPKERAAAFAGIKAMFWAGVVIAVALYFVININAFL